MSEKFNVIQVGFGPMGQLVTKLLLNRENVNFLGIVDIDPAFEGKKLNEILGSSDLPDLPIVKELEPLLNDSVDVVILATSSFFETIAPMIIQVVEAGANVITMCEQLSYPWDFHPELAEKIDKLAKEKKVTVTGSGINPGYLMDLLPIVLTAPCETVEKIHVTRMMNSSRRRIPFQKKIGTNLTIGEFNKKISDKEITGHVGLEESIQMIVSALGLKVDKIVEFPPKAMITEKEFDSPFGRVQEGYVRGLHSRGVAMDGNHEIVILDFFAYSGDHEEYDSIVIEGVPGINQKIIGGVHGDVGTASMIVNLIPKVVDANPGVLTMKDLPAPSFTGNIMKK
ncbi:MAG: dihydrodipicolinate reductase [Candidatus Heimdallarchaeota archaeon]|nr:dihydrodipicolinate reductase [Candidatus Heimdallarchaeota archaeon]